MTSIDLLSSALSRCASPPQRVHATLPLGLFLLPTVGIHIKGHRYRCAISFTSQTAFKRPLGIIWHSVRFPSSWKEIRKGLTLGRLPF